LQRFSASGLKLNKSKCIFGVTEVTFLGHKLLVKGLPPDSEKVKAIRNMPVPETKTDLQLFLGMVAYLSKFIPHISIKSRLISDDIILRFYSQNLSTKITCDASKTRLGATLQTIRRKVISSRIQI